MDTPTPCFCTACNSTYAVGGLVAILSALMCLPQDGPAARVYVLDGGMKPGQWKTFRQSIEGLGREHEIYHLKPGMERFEGLPKDWGSSVMTYARLTLPELVDEPRLIYLDADMVIQEDLSPMASIDLHGCTVAASPDIITPTLGDEKLPLEKYELDPAKPYLQAGFLVIDLVRWRDLKISAKVVDYLRENPEHSIHWDQSALNVVLYNDWTPLHTDYNTPAWWAQMGKEGTRLDAPVLHFVGPHKPWRLGHHQSPSADRFFRVVDHSGWAGWRPSRFRQFLKQVKYRVMKALRRH